jgi:hypothetical protein
LNRLVKFNDSVKKISCTFNSIFYIKKIDIISKVAFSYCPGTKKKTKTVKTKIYLVEETDIDRDIEIKINLFLRYFLSEFLYF